MDTSGIGKAAGGLIGQMFKKDADGNGKLSQAEYKDFLASKSGNSSVSDAAAAQSFNAMDADGDGNLTEAEAESFFTLPSVEGPKLDSATTASLLDALSQSNQESAQSSPDTLSQLLASYTASQKKTGGSFSGEA